VLQNIVNQFALVSFTQLTDQLINIHPRKGVVKLQVGQAKRESTKLGQGTTWSQLILDLQCDCSKTFTEQKSNQLAFTEMRQKIYAGYLPLSIVAA
jgi:hypothetical protein